MKINSIYSDVFRTIFTLLFLVIGSTLFFSCGPKEDPVVHVSSVSVSPSSLNLTEGETASLSAIVSPDNAGNKQVSWASSNAGVATVNEGVVNAVKEGTATITVTTKDGNKTATCSVAVSAKFNAVTGVSLDKTSASLKSGETVTLTATVNPSDATDKTVTWSTSDATVAKVSNGVVTAKKVGSATITAKAGDKTATCAITVTATAGGSHEGISEEDW